VNVSADRVRVRPLYSDTELLELYGKPWEQASSDHPHLAHCPNPWIYWDLMIAVGKSFTEIDSIADMSAGDGRISRALGEHHGVEPVLGDFAPGYAHTGTLQETVPTLGIVDLYICTNTVEHLDDPDADLKVIREHTVEMLLSTPVEEWNDPSGGHYWAWSRKGVEEMMLDAGFEVSAYVELDLTPYWNPHCKHGIWACR
jgi:hypothetical protein